MNKNPLISSVQASLGRKPGDPVPERPPTLPAQVTGTICEQVDKLITEITALSGNACRIKKTDIPERLAALVRQEDIKKAVLWSTPGLESLDINNILAQAGVDILPTTSDKHTLAECDLGITEADYALAETGTIGLLANTEKPRAISLLPRTHLVIMHESALKADLHPILADVNGRSYLVLITGPSRTADIELTVTLGVHGPRSLYVWILED
jgi:L-lactate dehydrogenase complex protein LldG